MEILQVLKNVMDNCAVFGLGLIGFYYTATGLGGLFPKKQKKRKITVSESSSNKAA